MIQGTVVGLQARIGVIFRVTGQEDLIEIDCIVDTGFEGFLTLPSAAIAQLGLPYLAQINANISASTKS